ncbi:unnamed protein product [Boreogadus saida]
MHFARKKRQTARYWRVRGGDGITAQRLQPYAHSWKSFSEIPAQTQRLKSEVKVKEDEEEAQTADETRSCVRIDPERVELGGPPSGRLTQDRESVSGWSVNDSWVVPED